MKMAQCPHLPSLSVDNLPPVHSIDYIRALWPEYYGFTISGEGPTYVVSVTHNGVAYQAGIRSGDQVETI